MVATMSSYYPISQFYKQKFGEKVWNIPVSIASTCPNREGLRGMKTCNFCDVWGSAAYPEVREESLREQIQKVRLRVAKRFNAKKFLVYFQSYTSTFQKTSKLVEAFEVALKEPDVVGFVVGTRPDCLSRGIFDLWNDYCQRTFVAVELGVQTFDNVQLEWMRRGHTAEQSLRAIEKVAQNCPEVNLGVHLMFGLPGETDEQLIQTARTINDLPVCNVKLHNLHVLKNTPLADDYNKGLFEPIDLEEYSRRVLLFLSYLRRDIAVHRLVAVASRYDELVAPQWTNERMRSFQYIIDDFKAKNIHQGQHLV